MANQQTLSDDEIQLRRRARRRLIGAVTLVTVMVVTLPMVLDGESKQSGQDIVISIPPQGSGGEFSAKTDAVAEPVKPGLPPAPPVPAAAPAESAAPADVPAAPVVTQSLPAVKNIKIQSAGAEEKPPVAPVAVQAVKASGPEGKKPVAATIEAQPKPKEAPSPPKRKDEKPAAKPDGGSFVVQLGAFASPLNAKDRQAKLTALKVKFYTETVKMPGGDRLRVRAGPYASRHEAERVQAKLKAAGIKDGVVAEKKN